MVSGNLILHFAIWIHQFLEQYLSNSLFFLTEIGVCVCSGYIFYVSPVTSITYFLFKAHFQGEKVANGFSSIWMWKCPGDLKSVRRNRTREYGKKMPLCVERAKQSSPKCWEDKTELAPEKFIRMQRFKIRFQFSNYYIIECDSGYLSKFEIKFWSLLMYKVQIISFNEIKKYLVWTLLSSLSSPSFRWCPVPWWVGAFSS